MQTMQNWNMARNRQSGETNKQTNGQGPNKEKRARQRGHIESGPVEIRGPAGFPGDTCWSEKSEKRSGKSRVAARAAPGASHNALATGRGKALGIVDDGARFESWRIVLCVFFIYFKFFKSLAYLLALFSTDFSGKLPVWLIEHNLS